MSSREALLKAIQRLKGQLDERREARRAFFRRSMIRELTTYRTEREGVFLIPKTPERMIGVILRPFSERFETIYREGFKRPVYRERETGRYVRRTLVQQERTKFRARNAARVIAQRFPALGLKEVRERVNRLTELTIRKGLGEDVDVDIAEIFGYEL